MLARTIVGLMALALALLTSGCGTRALLYSRTVRPLTTDFHATPVAQNKSQSNVKTLSFYVDVEWGDTGIGEIARQKGIAEIYYADVQTVTLLGYWKQNYVRVYGKPVSADAEVR